MTTEHSYEIWYFEIAEQEETTKVTGSGNVNRWIWEKRVEGGAEAFDVTWCEQAGVMTEVPVGRHDWGSFA